MKVGKYLEEPIPGTENTLISTNCPFLEANFKVDQFHVISITLIQLIHLVS